MIIKSLELENFRNYETLSIDFDSGTNILFGDNAQGKTNILEAIFLSATTKSHKGSKDRDIIRFDAEEAHIRTYVVKDGLENRVDMHLRKNRSKGIAINGQKIKKAADLLGLLNVVFFRRRISRSSRMVRRSDVVLSIWSCASWTDFYLCNLNNYNKVVNQRNKLLKELYLNPGLRDTLSVWDSQLVSYGNKIIDRRDAFVSQLNEIIYEIHQKLSGGRKRLRSCMNLISCPMILKKSSHRVRRGISGQSRLPSDRTGMIFLLWWVLLTSGNLARRDSSGQQHCR